MSAPVKLLENWTLPDHTFYPRCLSSIGNDTKTVLILPGEHNILTLVIKNLKDTVRSNGSPHKTSCIDLKCFGTITDTIVTAHNTISCVDSGQLIIFSSFRTCNPVEGAVGVKAINRMDSGKKLLLLRLTNDNLLQLNIVEDLTGAKLTQALKTYDLSWERTDIPTSRRDQCHRVGTIITTQENHRFFQRFLNCGDIPAESEQILFTVDNGLFWLKDLNENFEVVTVKLFTSTVTEFSYAPCTGSFFVLLENAALIVYCISEDPKRIMIQEQNIYLGHTLEAHRFVPELSVLIYSDGFQMVQIRCFFSELSKTIEKETQNIPISGVTGITYFEDTNTGICVTENRLFYTFVVGLPNDQKGQSDDFFELTDEVFSQTRQMTHFLTNEIKCGKKIIKLVEKERSKFNSLVYATNMSLHQSFVKCTLIIRRGMPDKTYLWIGEPSTDTIIFAEITICFSKNFQHSLVQQNSWCLALSIDSVEVRQIKLSSIKFSDSNLCFLYPIGNQYLKKRGLPAIAISLTIAVQHFNDCINLHIPLDVKEPTKMKPLFEVCARNTPECSETNDDYQYTIDSLTSFYSQHSVNIPKLEWCLSKPTTINDITSLLSILNIDVDGEVNRTTDVINIRIGNLFVAAQLKESQNAISFESHSPGAMLLLKRIWCEKQEQPWSENSAALKVILLELMHCEPRQDSLIKLYRQIRTANT